jgi:hypothetical protein
VYGLAGETFFQNCFPRTPFKKSLNHFTDTVLKKVRWFLSITDTGFHKYPVPDCADFIVFALFVCVSRMRTTNGGPFVV